MANTTWFGRSLALNSRLAVVGLGEAEFSLGDFATGVADPGYSFLRDFLCKSPFQTGYITELRTR